MKKLLLILLMLSFTSYSQIVITKLPDTKLYQCTDLKVGDTLVKVNESLNYVYYSKVGSNYGLVYDKKKKLDFVFRENFTLMKEWNSPQPEYSHLKDL